MLTYPRLGNNGCPRSLYPLCWAKPSCGKKPCALGAGKPGTQGPHLWGQTAPRLYLNLQDLLSTCYMPAPGLPTFLCQRCCPCSREEEEGGQNRPTPQWVPGECPRVNMEICLASGSQPLPGAQCPSPSWQTHLECWGYKDSSDPLAVKPWASCLTSLAPGSSSLKPAQAHKNAERQ